MTALEAMDRASAAGLRLEPVPNGVRVRGPKPARTALLPVLAPLAGEIFRLLARAPENRRAEVTPDRVSNAGLTEGTPGPTASRAEPCGGCGRTDWLLTLLDDDGGRTCLECLSGRTAMRARGVPL